VVFWSRAKLVGKVWSIKHRALSPGASFWNIAKAVLQKHLYSAAKLGSWPETPKSFKLGEEAESDINPVGLESL
jgi:hypothetical protein